MVINILSLYSYFNWFKEVGSEKRGDISAFYHKSVDKAFLIGQCEMKSCLVDETQEYCCVVLKLNSLRRAEISYDLIKLHDKMRLE